MRLIDIDAFWNYVRSHKINFGKYQHDLLNRQPTVQAVPIDVLDKIRVEIADLDDADYDYEGYYKAVTDALKIIDKYKAESEDEE